MNSSLAPRVFFQGDAASAHGRRILEGVAEYGHALHQPWAVRWGTTLPSLPLLQREGFVGIVFFNVPSNRLAELRRSALAFVRVSSISAVRGVSHVIPDNHAIGRLAARHFMDRNFRDFAFVGCDEHTYSRHRLEGFREGVGGHPLRSFSCTDAADTARLLPGFLAELPTRTALFAANDIFARRSMDMLETLGVRIPEDRSLLGVDNDPLIGLSTSVALSSIDPASDEIGRRAAAMLARLMAGAPNLGETEQVPPTGVVLRASSDQLATTDDLVNRAVRIIRREACSGLSVSGLCNQLGVGRRVFERRFRGVLGKTIEAEMRRERLEHAKKLLLATALATERVAEQSGFSDPFYFSAAFRKATGLSPRAWRNAQAPPRTSRSPVAPRARRAHG